MSVHGANRLGSNSLSQCSVWGRITGIEAAENASKKRTSSSKFTKLAEQEEKKIFEIADSDGHTSPYEIRDALHKTMEEHLYVYRNIKGMKKAQKRILELRKIIGDIYVGDRGSVYNTNLRETFEIMNLLDLSWVIIEGALRRHESRGAHVVVEYPKRDDKRWLKHTIASKSLAGIRFEYVPVKLHGWQPEERKY